VRVPDKARFEATSSLAGNSIPDLISNPLPLPLSELWIKLI